MNLSVIDDQQHKGTYIEQTESTCYYKYHQTDNSEYEYGELQDSAKRISNTFR